ncbi:MAG: hydantoinase/oxoprolinase family protein [Rhodospirillales bacterium]
MRGDCAVGIDVGGTFTDFVLFDPVAGRMTIHKEPSTPDDPTAAIGTGLAALLDRAGLPPGRVGSVTHGTTLGLNALLQRRGARVVLMVSEGFGDMLELARGDLPNPYDYTAPKPVPAVPRERVLEIPARLRPDGTVLARPAPADLDRLAAAARALGAEAVTVSVVNAYAHPDLERETAAALADRLPGVPVTAAATVWPEIREFERTLVAVMDAQIHPLLDRYLGRLATVLADAGVAAPLEIATSTGGCVSAPAARARPIDTLLSGPAAGAIAAARVAALAGRSRVVTLDMGGTSSDIAIVEGGAPRLANETRLGDQTLMLPVIDVGAIGAGGGSVVWVDAEGVLKVGPHSAGADPGPMAYGRGGDRPTVTDCFLVCGLVDPDDFLGGRMRLDPDAARRGLAAIAARIGLADAPDPAIAAAEAALRVATARMAAEVTKGFARRGLDVRAFTLMPFGGAGPTQAARLAEATGVREVLVPPRPGTFCALGAVVGDVRRNWARSLRLRLGVRADAGAALSAAAHALEAEAAAWLAEEGRAAEEGRVEVSVDMQYPRTEAAFTIPVPEAVWRAGDAAALAELFRVRHREAYGFADARSPVDVTTVRLGVSAARADVLSAVRAVPPGAAPPGRPPRAVAWRGARVVAPVLDRAALVPGTPVPGPAIVRQEDTTTWVPPGWTARADDRGNLILSDGAAR